MCQVSGPLAVERLVGQPVGVLVLLARHPGVRRAAGTRQRLASSRQRPHVGVLDLPAADICSTTSLESIRTSMAASGAISAASSSPAISRVLRDVVGRDADRGAVLGDHLTGVGVLRTRAVRRRAGVATRAAVGLDQTGGSPPS
jgi:hypothetical protein